MRKAGTRIAAIEASKEKSFDVLELIDGRLVERYSEVISAGAKAAGRVWNFVISFNQILAFGRQNPIGHTPILRLVANICRIIGKDIDLGLYVVVVHIAVTAFSRKYDPVTSRPAVIATVPLDIQ
jgi:hypothetical protein